MYGGIQEGDYPSLLVLNSLTHKQDTDLKTGVGVADRIHEHCLSLLLTFTFESQLELAGIVEYSQTLTGNVVICHQPNRGREGGAMSVFQVDRCGWASTAEGLSYLILKLKCRFTTCGMQTTYNFYHTKSSYRMPKMLISIPICLKLN